jgi:comEA protein
MRKTLWNGLAACVAVVALAASSGALAAKKKTDASAADASAKTDKVNLNTADEKTIAGAKGVGAKLAKELVTNRPYKTWDDVSKVKGVGSGKKLESLQKVLKLTEGVGAAEKTDTKSKSSSKADEKAAPAAAGAAAGGAAASGKASSEPSSPSQKSSSSAASAKLAPGTKININTASAEELDKLPEIGPVKAQAIVEYRKANGPFKSAEDIEKVKGIKEGTFAKIKDYIVVK